MVHAYYRNKILREKQTSDLIAMHGSFMLLKQNKESVIHLSKNEMQPKMLDIFSIGINCYLKWKFERTQRKVEMEIDGKIKKIIVPEWRRF